MLNETVKNLLNVSSDEIFVINNEGDILFQNLSSKNSFGSINNINEITHLFEFDVAILNSEDVINYTPINAMLLSKENFTANVTRQLSRTQFAEYTIYSHSDNDMKYVIMKNLLNDKAIQLYQNFEEKSASQKAEISKLTNDKIKIENNLLKSNLINIVANKIQSSIDTNEILNSVFSEIKKTFKISNIEFSDNSEEIQDIKIEKISINNIEYNKISVPVINGEMFFGNLIIYTENVQDILQKEELDLVKNIANLLSLAFNRAKLFEKLNEQKIELEKALAELKATQLQIVQTEKLASLGQLVAGVAHEINTPLGAITSNIDLFEKIVNSNSSKEEILELVNEMMPVTNEAISRIKKMIHSLKNFARLDEAKLKRVNIHEGLNSTLDLISHEIKSRITVIKEYSDLPEINCYPDYLNQVFMNILMNALQSIKDEGKITIRTFKQDDNIVIEIQDTGSGISKENLENIFEFGFTTKKRGEGTGLGLALAKKIIKEHNGKIEVSSELDKGTIFSIYLPIN